MRKIIVLGAGAIGSVIAAKLSDSHDVLLVGRKTHVDKINNHGLELTGAIKKTFRVKAVTAIKNIDSNTTIFLTTKSQDTHKAISEIKDKIRKDTLIVCIQNGYGSEGIVKDLVSCKVVRLVTMIGAMFLEDGTVQITTLGNTFVPTEEKEIIQLFSESDIPVNATQHIQEELWKKLILNCVINGLGSVLRVPNNQLNSPYLKDLKHGITSECIAVAQKEGVIIDTSIETLIDKVIDVSTNTNSTLQDLMKHKKTEIDFLNGAIVRMGAKYDIKTPVNSMIWSIIKTAESL